MKILQAVFSMPLGTNQILMKKRSVYKKAFFLAFICVIWSPRFTAVSEQPNQ